MPTVADVLVASLLQAGVPRLFGVPGGGSSLELLAAARAAGLPFVLCHHESAAVVMAGVTAELLSTQLSVHPSHGELFIKIAAHDHHEVCEVPPAV